MLNSLLNRITAIVLKRKMDTYRRYPPAQSLLVLIDVNPAFLEAGGKLQQSLVEIAAFARQHGIQIGYCNFGGLRPEHAVAPGVEGLFVRLDTHEDTGETDMLAPQTADIVFPERTTLSAFFDGALIAHLQSNGIEHVVFAGAFADLSIDSTARHASELGFHTTVLSDCCGATSIGAHHATMGVTLPRMVHLVTTSADWFADVQKSQSSRHNKEK